MSGIRVFHNVWHGCWYITDGGTKLATCYNEREVEEVVARLTNLAEKTPQAKERKLQLRLAELADPITGKVECAKLKQPISNA